jgi:hypothetical protein
MLACVCADGSFLPPAIIFGGKGALESSWVGDKEAEKHQVFLATSPSGWTNNQLGLVWLEQVSDRCTKKKAQRRWRLLILDGHGSHLTMDFIKYCNANKILIVIFPPHSTHSLQPLNMVMFKPLSTAYLNELLLYLHQSQSFLTVKKGDFFLLFWAAWTCSFKEELVRTLFEATGIIPMNAEIILKRFNNNPLENSDASSLQSEGDGSDWRDVCCLIEKVVVDSASKLLQKLKAALHSFQVQNELLNSENNGLRAALTVKKKHGKKNRPLDLQQRKEYHGGAVFWSPRKVKEAEARQVVKQREAELQKLYKSQQKKLKAAAALYKKQQLEETRKA